MSGTRDVCLAVEDLVVSIEGTDEPVDIVQGVSFELHRGETLGLVGESGSGKSVTLSAIMGILPPGLRVSAGSIRFEGREISRLAPAQMRALRGKHLALIPQDPMSAFNPVRTIGAQLIETLRLHDRTLTRRTAKERAIEALRQVGIAEPSRKAAEYPHEWSGGMRQRALIASAMAHAPEILVADEPTTALDVTVQAQVMKLLAEQRQRTGTAMILVTHDLGLIAQVADRVSVMYAGRIVESSDVFSIFDDPQHPYTAGLLRSVRSLGAGEASAYAIAGQPPTVRNRPTGCAFQPRCPVGSSRHECGTMPAIRGPEEHRVACHFAPFSLTDGLLDADLTGVNR